MSLDTSKAQLLDDLRHEQDAFEALLDEIGDERMTQLVAPDWSLKDIIAHLTGWRRRSVARFQAALRHEPHPAPPWPSHLQTDDEITAWIYAANRDKSVADVRRESRETFDQLVETLAAFPEAELRDPANFPWLEGEAWNGAAFFGHFHEEHEADMRAALDKMGSGEQ
jgi:hypothetical protein